MNINKIKEISFLFVQNLLKTTFDLNFGRLKVKYGLKQLQFLSYA